MRVQNINPALTAQLHISLIQRREADEKLTEWAKRHCLEPAEVWEFFKLSTQLLQCDRRVQQWVALDKVAHVWYNVKTGGQDEVDN